MSTEWRDPKYLLDMLLAARDATTFVADLTKERFEESKLVQYAVVRAIQIVGEAASRVTQATRDTHPAIPWTQIIGMRHRLVHDYTRIDTDIVWEVAAEDLKELIPLLEKAVPPEE